jgi:NAD-dependent dihydropyrimidine dehydrogenase PreA subunit
MAIVTISENCTGCKACIETCPQKILALGENEKMHVVDHGKCMSCYGCEDVCNFGAVFNKKAPFPEMTADEIETEDNPKLASEYDVIVVGAGPAGLGAAISCAGEGLNTAVFERLPNRKVSHHNDGGCLFSFPSTTSINITDGHVEFPEINIKLALRYCMWVTFAMMWTPARRIGQRWRPPPILGASMCYNETLLETGYGADGEMGVRVPTGKTAQRSGKELTGGVFSKTVFPGGHPCPKGHNDS